MAFKSGSQSTYSETASLSTAASTVELRKTPKRFMNSFTVYEDSDVEINDNVGDMSVVGSDDEDDDALMDDAGDKIPEPNHLLFQALSHHLGGLSIGWTLSKYETKFGVVSRLHPFGSDVWDGMRERLPEYKRMMGTKLFGDVEWYGVYFMPGNFSRQTSRVPISDEAPSSTQQYPAIVFMNSHQSAMVEAAVAKALGKSSDDDSLYDNIKILSKSALRSPNDLWSQSTGRPLLTVELDIQGSFEVQMGCLKIILACSRPWWVDLSRLTLYRPLSRL